MKPATVSAIRSEIASPQAQPYGKARNARIWAAQKKLEAQGMFNRLGSLISPIVRVPQPRGTSYLMAKGGK